MELLEYFALGAITNPVCRNHTLEIVKNLGKKKIWALKMFDATPKFISGIMTGNLIHYGNIDECMDVTVNEDFGNFTGKHCLVHFPLKLTPQNTQINLEIQRGACIPSSCSASDLQHFLRNSLHLPAVVDELECHTIHDEKPFQTREIVTIGLLSFLLLLVILSTFYDFCASGKKSKLLLAFSFPRNFGALMNTKTPPESIDALHGIRFFAIAWVVLAHVYMGKMQAGNDINRRSLLTWLSDWNHIWLTSRGILVDAFFVLGGSLATYVFMIEREKGKTFNVLIYYLHRYLRMAPALAVVLLFEATLSNRLGTGPVWDSYSSKVEKSCQENWWKHLLFINNWWGTEICMEHTWYLCVDMQLHFVAPALLFPLHRWPKTGLGLIFSAIIVSFLASFGLSYGLEENVDLFRNANSQLERTLYHSTYHRITPWLIGLLMGYFLYKYRHLKRSHEAQATNKSVSAKLKKFLIGTILWICSISLALIVWCTVHPFIQPDYVYNALESAVYLATSHILISLFMVACTVLILTEYGGPFAVLFSWKFFVPLSRVSYCVYLIHLLIVKVRLGDAKTTEFLSDFNLVMCWLGMLVYAVIFSPFVFLMVEQPFAIIEKYFLHKGNSYSTKTDSEQSTSQEASTLPISQAKGGGYINSNFELSGVYSIEKPG